MQSSNLSRHLRRGLFLIPLVLLLSASAAFAQTSTFTYQGRLTDGGTPANGNYDLQFGLWDSLSGGSQIGSTQTVSNVSVSAGIFTVTLDFGANAFPGANRFLEISARLSGASSFTLLLPRQPITSTPYAFRSGNATFADTATNATQLGGVGASQYVQTSDSRLTDSRSPTAGSSNYIQNSTNQQSSSTFNISGNGTASGSLSGNIVNAVVQYNIGGARLLSSPGTINLFAGVTAGASNTTGTSNAFFGFGAGSNNTTGSQNSFFGYAAGSGNTTGSSNSFFGLGAGNANTTGSNNSFFGDGAGDRNSTGQSNTFVGEGAGFFNTTANQNSFFGQAAGFRNTTGHDNTFIGYGAGPFNIGGPNAADGTSNTFVGSIAGFHNDTGGFNAFFGWQAGISNTGGASNTFIGENAGVSNTIENKNTFIGSKANGMAGITNAAAVGANASVTQSNSLVLGSINGANGATADTNVGIGTTAPSARLHIAVNGGNILAGNAGCISGFNGIGFGPSLVGCSNYSLLGNGTDTIVNRPTGGAIHFRENNGTQMTIAAGGVVSINTLGPAGSTQLCRNASNQIATCSSSLRYKTGIAPFAGGLEIVNRLRPITFNWKQGGGRDIGLAAEDVAAVEPLFTFTNEKGEIEGVKYNQLSVVLINAIKEQQRQINQQSELEAQQQNQIKALQQANRALGGRLQGIERMTRKRIRTRRR